MIVTSQASSPTGATAISTSIHFTVGAIPSPRCTWRWGASKVVTVQCERPFHGPAIGLTSS